MKVTDPNHIYEEINLEWIKSGNGELYLLEYNAMQSVESQLTLQTNMLPPS
jgi:hypothetical protein